MALEKPKVALDEADILDATFVRAWSRYYPGFYDADYYAPYILRGRAGEPTALRSLTEWKNVGSVPRPMKLSRFKEKAFQDFLKNLSSYRGKRGRQKLRQDFSKRAPVYSIFWYHVLFDTPIFDVHTNRAYQWFVLRQRLRGRTAAVVTGRHWKLYFAYARWFRRTLRLIRQSDPSLTARDLDRALFVWGKRHA